MDGNPAPDALQLRGSDKVRRQRMPRTRKQTATHTHQPLQTLPISSSRTPAVSTYPTQWPAGNRLNHTFTPTESQ